MLKLIFRKDDPKLFAVLLSLGIEPMPYTIDDKAPDLNAGMVLLTFKEDIPLSRIYWLGIYSERFEKVFAGLMRDHKPGGKHFSDTGSFPKFNLV